MINNPLHLLAPALHLIALGRSLLLWKRHRNGWLGWLSALLACLILPPVLALAQPTPVPVTSVVLFLLIALMALATTFGLTDVFDLRPSRLAESLRISEAKFSKVFRASPDAVTLSTLRDGKFQEVNEGFTTITGYSREETLGRTSGDLNLWVKPADRQLLVKTLQETGRVRDLETVFRNKSGEERDCQISADVLELDGVANLLFVVRDISERTKAERERLLFIDELEKKNSELERFVYTVSHDLRSPLVTIQGFLGFLEKDLAMGKAARMRRDMERIRNAADTMQQLLDELLELSRVGRLVNPPTEVHVGDLVRQAVELVAGPIHKRGVDVEIAADLPVVRVDQARLLEVFQNLVENAVKFMGDQEHPRIEIGWSAKGRQREHSDAQDAPGRETSHSNSNEFMFFVQDNGIGIKTLYQEKIFGLFERLDQEVVGTGIGLALVKRIIEVHGGRIWVESQGLGHGSRFCFTLPQPPSNS